MCGGSQLYIHEHTYILYLNTTYVNPLNPSSTLLQLYIQLYTLHIHLYTLIHALYTLIHILYTLIHYLYTLIHSLYTKKAKETLNIISQENERERERSQHYECTIDDLRDDLRNANEQISQFGDQVSFIVVL